jgi:glycosyltransferase involved in cell wall biosynthesis
MNSHVEILLSTFNGEKYLETQLNSIFEQDYPYWKLVVRDDGSTDGTIYVLNNYIQKNPDKIRLLRDNEGHLGYSGSFSKLLGQSSADYVIYCDQDDYWHPAKISTMLSAMLEEETRLPATAHIIFSDLQITDSELKVIYPSFLEMVGYSAHRGEQIFFLKNYVPGCNLLFNRALLNKHSKQKILLTCTTIGC